MYPESDVIPELYGLANDIPAWLRLLTNPKGFALPPANVTTLVELGRIAGKAANPGEHPEGVPDPGRTGRDGRPGTYDGLSGHGTQVPIPPDQDPLDPKNFEPDGMDEVFLPGRRP